MSQYQLTNRRGVCYATGSKSDCMEAALREFGISDKPFLLESRERNGVTILHAHAPYVWLCPMFVSLVA